MFDLFAWGVALAIAVFLRLGLEVGDEGRSGFWRALPVVFTLQLISGFATGLYRRRWRYGSHDEVAALCITTFLTSIGVYGLNEYYFEVRPVPQSALIVGAVFGLVLMAAVRYAWRLTLERARRPTAHTAEKLLVFGAGDGGLQIVSALMRNPSSRYLPVGILDDAPKARRLKVMGVPVLGGRDAIPQAVQRTRATTMLIALPAADGRTITELADLAERQGLAVKVLPPVDELIDGRVHAEDIRDLTDEDLLGRRQIDTDVDAISGYISGRRVLVTGAGGSIGSELCRQLYRLNPSELMMLDRDESALHAVEMSIHGRSLLNTPETVLADIRDVEALQTVFNERRPEVVFHAAALKHLTLLERYPDEAYKSNVIGSLNVLNAAVGVGVGVFVNVSSDKAANPTSILGYSKRVAERLTAGVTNANESSRFLSVRFGNVLGSRGSVLGIFKSQIERGGPLTVTDRAVTRYFMTIPEAVQLVIQAGAIGASGEILILDMGEPVNIYELAQRLVQRSGRDVPIEITGLRPGEKKHEDLLGIDEQDSRPQHPLISHTKAPPLDSAELERYVESLDDHDCQAVMINNS